MCVEINSVHFFSYDFYSLFDTILKGQLISPKSKVFVIAQGWRRCYDDTISGWSPIGDLTEWCQLIDQI